MPLPPPPSKTATNTATAAAVAPASAPAAAVESTENVTVQSTDSGNASNAKKFGPAKDEQGNAIPAPKPCGLDLVELSKSLKVTVDQQIAALGITADQIVEAIDALDKGDFPGNKAGKIAYKTGGIVADIYDIFEALTKKRGAGGLAKAIKDRDAKLEKLTELLGKLGGKLGLSADEIAALTA
jgi:hypothetical protein